MTNTGTRTDGQVSTERATSRAWWFLGTLAILRNPEGASRTPAVIELTVPPGGSPPRHVHDALDDSFLVLDGQVVVRCGERTMTATAGTYVALPARVEHTFRVTSPVPARLLLVHADDSFLDVIEALGTPADELRLPSADEQTVIPDFETIARVNAEHGVRIVGPSLEDDEVGAVEAGAGPAGLGAVNHVALHVTDLRRSQRWYAHSLDLVPIDGELDNDGAGHVTLVSPSGGWVLALASADRPGVEHVAFTCPDRVGLIRWRDTLAERNADPGTITDAPYGSGFVVRDPDGIELELFTPAAPQ
jgi:mannose-6-phosphate isomerase-like protein (cupin superfamily)/catechol 2,3-dioxygenase-like lactoylglutathione lyase family enzyme